MKNKIKYIICILIIIFSILIIRSTYSKYQNETKGIIEKKVANWVVKVNSSDIVNETEFEFTSNFKYVEENQTVKEGAIAPGLSGYFLIAIDTTNTKVSVDEEITIDQTELRKLSNGGNLKITGVESLVFDSATELDVRYTSTGAITGIDLDKDIIKVNLTKLLTDTGGVDKITGIKVEVTWEDSTDEEDMLDDYRIASSGIDLELPVHVRVSQHT